MTDHRILRFNGFELDLRRGRLQSGNNIIDLRPKAFEILRLLAENAGRVVPKQELNDAVWPDVVVSDDSLVQCIRELRDKLGDHEHRLIRTVHRRGYLLDVPVLPADGPPLLTRAPSGDAAARSIPPLPDLPSIAVLPFDNLSGDPEQVYLADGVVDDIITELSRFRELFVIARNSSFQYKARAVDVREVGRDLGVRYVLEGSVQRSGNRVRVAAQLIDAESGRHLWAEKHDHDLADLLSLRDAVARRVVGAVQPQIIVGESRRAVRKSPTNLDAIDCCMRGTWHFHQGAAEHREAETWLCRAIELDPAFARAHLMLARVLAGRCWFAHQGTVESDLARGLAAAKRAVVLDETDSAAYYPLAILSLMAGDHARALDAAERSIELNPNSALGYFALGETQIFLGRFSEGLDALSQCLRLSPRDPMAFLFFSLMAVAHYHLGDYDNAVRCSERALQRRRNYVVLRTLAASLGQLRRTQAARSVIAEMEGIEPPNAQRHWELTAPYADPAHKAHLLEGLKQAGLPLA